MTDIEGLKYRMNENQLLFRRQFLFTPIACNVLSHWPSVQIGDHYLYAHPDLELTFHSSSEKHVQVALLGYMLDPHSFSKSNSDILNQIVNLIEEPQQLHKLLNFMTGRYVLIIKKVSDINIYHDPCGLRTVYYTDYKGMIVAGSQPLILNQVIPINGGNRLKTYLQSKYVRDNIEHWLPSGISLYEDVNHLIPNHYLTCSSCRQIRYWPNEKLPRRNLDDVIVDSSNLLRNLMKAAEKRYKLALTVTAGLDTRIVLGACKDIAQKLFCYTLIYRGMDHSSNDIKIPKELANNLNLDHHLIDCHQKVDLEFRKIYEQNSSPSHFNDWGKIANGVIKRYPANRISVKGNCSEILRCFYYKYGNHQPIKKFDQIVDLEKGWSEIPFVKKQIEIWFSEAINVAAHADIDILDLFYWEHRMGSWQAQSQLEWDIVQEVYTPFNHRELIELMIGVDKKFRCSPKYVLYEMIIDALWPETMMQPVNPPSIKSRILNGLNNIGLYDPVKRLYQKISKK